VKQQILRYNTPFFLLVILRLKKKNGNPYLFNHGLFPSLQCSLSGSETSSYCDRLRRKEGRAEVSGERKRSEEEEKTVAWSKAALLRYTSVPFQSHVGPCFLVRL